MSPKKYFEILEKKMQKETLLLRKNIFKYLILGSNGLLGSEFKKILPKKYTLTIAKKNSDININLKKFPRELIGPLAQ